MKNLFAVLVATLITSSLSFAGEAASKGSKFESLEEYKNGVLTITMDTCGGTIQPVVKFKAVEEIVDKSMHYGAYFASIRPSKELSGDSICPMMMPTHFELNLVELLKAWAHSDQGTAKTRAIFAHSGHVEIVVPQVTTTLRLTTKVK